MATGLPHQFSLCRLAVLMDSPNYASQAMIKGP